MQFIQLFFDILYFFDSCDEIFWRIRMQKPILERWLLSIG